MADIFLLPGDCVAVKQPIFLKTILGSCVAVALFDRKAKIAGLNHFLLPKSSRNLPDQQRGRYGDTAIPLLIKKLVDIGADAEILVGGIFGGGSVNQDLKGEFRVGELNIELARNLLANLGVHVISEDVGGSQGRFITFDTSTFSVDVRELTRSG